MSPFWNVPTNIRDINMKKKSFTQTTSLCSSFEVRHKGTEVISSTCLKPSWARDGKTFICRHNYKKRACVFRKAEQSRAKQKRREKGALSTRPNRGLQRQPYRLLKVIHCDCMGHIFSGWCQQMTKTQQSKLWGKNQSQLMMLKWSTLRFYFVCPLSGLLQWDTLNANSDHRKRTLMVWKQNGKSDRKNVSTQACHAVIRKISGLLTSPANKLPREPPSPLKRPSKNTLAC